MATVKFFDFMIISEKPKVAEKIAKALGSNNGRKVFFDREKRVYRYELNVNGSRIAVVPAVGHVFNLKQKSNGFRYPVFDIEWVESFKVNKKAEYVKPYVSQLAEFARKSKNYIVACDYDIEGQTIAYNILKYLCKLSDEEIKNISRMKFSALTPKDIREAFLKPISFDLNLAYAGELRAVIDWWWGINTSRALMISLKKRGLYKVLSMGRVQGPTLNLVFKREQEIRNFKPTPFWRVYVEILIGNKKFLALHVKNIFWNKEEAVNVKTKCKSRKCIVSDVKRRKNKLKPPIPFNLGDLQREAYSKFGFKPLQTQKIAQNLYENGLISYPRTSSQKLPKNIDFRELFRKLAEQEKFKALAEKLLAKEILKPNEGKKEDPAHPCIYPTGEKPKSLNPFEKKVYELIVYRFLAVFADEALIESTDVILTLDGENFKLKGKVVLSRGWMEFYPYYKPEEAFLPKINLNDSFATTHVYLKEGQTKPPARYSQASLISTLERNNLGTKATRALILEKLFSRGYIKGRKSIEITPFGEAVIQTFNLYCKEILSVDLTRELEVKLEAVSLGKEKKENVLIEAKKKITEIMEKMKRNEDKIGETLEKALSKTFLKKASEVKTGFTKLIKP